MNKEIHRSSTRGHMDHGWLNTHHTFSFAHYHNPERMHFGVLRVLNDDIVTAGKGFGTHPHDNMEIISIPLRGELTHHDNMGNIHVIRTNDVQVMSAGTGVQHSEFNENPDGDTNFLQIWVFPDQRNVQPRYGQMTFDPEKKKNALLEVISPTKDDQSLWIHQEAWFHLGDFDKDMEFSYDFKNEGDGIYIFILEGSFLIDGDQLDKRDGIGISGIDKVDIKVVQNGSILIMEVPLN